MDHYCISERWQHLIWLYELQKQAIKPRKIKLLKTLATRVDIEARDSRPESSGGEFAQIQSSQRFGHFQPNPLKI